MYISNPKTSANSVPSVFSVLNLGRCYASPRLRASPLNPPSAWFRVYSASSAVKGRVNQKRHEPEPKSNQKRTARTTPSKPTSRSEPKSNQKRIKPEPNPARFRTIGPKTRATHCNRVHPFRAKICRSYTARTSTNSAPSVFSVIIPAAPNPSVVKRSHGLQNFSLAFKPRFVKHRREL
jgi:hypothetical protein